MDDLRDLIAKRLRELREAAGLTQGELADSAGSLSRAYLSEVERGEKSLGVETLGRLARALGVDPVELLRRPVKGNPPTPEEVLGRRVAALARGKDKRAIEKFGGIAKLYFSK